MTFDFKSYQQRKEWSRITPLPCGKEAQSLENKSSGVFLIMQIITKH